MPIVPIFAISFGFVLLSRLAIGVVFPDFDISLGTWIYWGAAPVDIVEKSIILICVFQFSTILFLLINRKSELNFPSVERLFNRQNIMEATSVLIMLLTLPIYLYRGLVVFNGIAESGYLATFTGEVKAPFWVNIGVALFQTSYYFFLASFPNKRKFYVVSSIFLLATISSLGTGQRTELVTAVLFVLFVNYFYKYNSFSIAKFLPAGAALILISISINAIRFGDDPLSALYLGFIDFLWGQGITLFTIIGSLEHAKEFSIFEGLLFFNKFLSCDVAPYFSGEFCNNSLAVTNMMGVWWQKLTYILDPIKFGEGGGLGGSIIPSLYLMFNFDEFYVASFFFFISVLVFWMIVDFFHRRAFGSNYYLRVYSLFFLNGIIFIPRAGLDSLVPHPRLLFSGLIIAISCEFFKMLFLRRVHHN